MNVDELAKLTIKQLYQIKNKNLLFFNICILLNLLVFYRAIYLEMWWMMFMCIGFLIAGVALYDNYRISKRLIQERI